MNILNHSDEDERLDLTDDDRPPAKTPRLERELYKPPTTEELNSLRDTDMLFHSNLIKLQITELLKEITLPEKRRKMIDEFLHALHDVIMELPVTDKMKLTNCQKLFDNIRIPFVMKPANAKGIMTCAPPADIQVVGSYLLHTNLKQNLNVDLVLELPQVSMQAKDYLNQRYLRKRAVYLTYIAYYLKSNHLISEVKFGYFLENPLKSILLLTPSGKLSKTLIVRVHVCPGQGHFKPERFLPSKSNVRMNWFTGISNDDDKSTLRPTPHYNNLVLSDMLMVDHLKHIFEKLAEFEGIRDGIKLLKVWLRQRELDQGQGSFSGFILSMVACYLLEKRKINKMMSSYQVVRNFFQFMSSTDWTVQGIGMNSSDVSEFHQYFEVVFMDPSGTLNLCADVTAAAYRQVCHEASLSLQTLDDKTVVNGFDAVFMTPVPFVRSFDHILHISKPWMLQNSCEELNFTATLPDYGGNAITCSIPRITSLLQQGLGTRVERVAVKGCQYGMWDISSHPPQWKQPVTTPSFGFALGNDATSVLDKGPAAETPEAASFRQFWGDKSELRRFQDGSICEAVVWECKSKTEKRNLVEKITRHILKLHCSLSGASLCYVSNQIENILRLKTDLEQRDYVPVPGYVGTGDEVNLRLIQSYNELCSQMRSLKDLPLTVVSLQGISPALRYTQVYPPTQVQISQSQVMKKVMKKIQVPDDASSSPPYIHPIEIICHLEGSGKWPQDTEALRRLKAAFHITFADELENAFKDLTCVPTQNYFDVLKDGFVFRVIIAYHREVTIMQTVTTEDGLVKTVTTPESLELEERSVHLPRLASTLHGLAQEHPAFSLTCRLVKRWVNGHMLSSHIPEIVLELLCAYLYTNPRPYSEPGSGMAGFLRFLWIISSFDFASNPLIVNLNDGLKNSDVSSIQDHFRSYRDSLPTMFIATPKDKTRSTWTRKHPTPMILHRLQGLAAITLKKVERKIANAGKDLAFDGIFTGSLAAYDVVIHLESKCVARKYERSQGVGDIVKDNEAPQSNAKILPVVGFDPVKCFLDELESAYDEIAAFFHNENGGTEVGVLWRPKAFDAKDFKITNMLGTSLISKNRVAVDVNAVIEDFRTIGRGLVSNVELRTDKWKL